MLVKASIFGLAAILGLAASQLTRENIKNAKECVFGAPFSAYGGYAWSRLICGPLTRQAKYAIGQAEFRGLSHNTMPRAGASFEMVHGMIDNRFCSLATMESSVPRSEPMTSDLCCYSKEPKWGRTCIGVSEKS
ncbi:uncharacterized protein LOC100904377 [Galendromus occidentalis]|uniref:Uncharacterized protein LOC100904377 n=1 Tax=Galendromus occidentalis TaxID=34638 RepID=A0AAJ6QU28_9ACAR|nr:uncharacterized protein LOC100904377 [Galendromus occidentalis]